ncbi:MAG: class I SAM-dependent methyltransferase, partial [Solirubrobacteraceae bacterium]
LTCSWEQLDCPDRHQSFDAVLCVGNSLGHAPGAEGRRAALRQMSAVLRPGGLLLVGSGNWAALRQQRPRLTINPRVVERRGIAGLVVYAWSIPERWDDCHELEIAVGLLEGGGRVVTHTGRLAYWPYRQRALIEDLESAGLGPVSIVESPDAYLAAARTTSGSPRATGVAWARASPDTGC